MAAFWTDCYRFHFQRFFQKPLDIQAFHDQDGFALKLAIHDWATRSYRVYASMGLADKLVANDEDDFGEVILFSDVIDKEVPHLFVNALFFILQNDIPLGSRFAIAGIEQMRPAFARHYQKSALYFTLAEEQRPPFGAKEEQTFNKVRNGAEFGRVYQAFFIAPEEDRYLEEYGPDAFENKWGEQKDPNSLRRPSCLSADDDTPKIASQDPKSETRFTADAPPIDPKSETRFTARDPRDKKT
jgi:hypothetical protein